MKRTVFRTNKTFVSQRNNSECKFTGWKISTERFLPTWHMEGFRLLKFFSNLSYQQLHILGQRSLSSNFFSLQCIARVFEPCTGAHETKGSRFYAEVHVEQVFPSSCHHCFTYKRHWLMLIALPNFLELTTRYWRRAYRRTKVGNSEQQ